MGLVATLSGCKKPEGNEKVARPSASTASPKPQVPRVFQDQDLRLETLSTARCQPEPPFLPPADHERISVKIQVTSRSSVPIPVQALALRLETDREERFAATLAGCKPPLSALTLSDGQTATGDVAFDVPLRRGPLELVYEPFLLGRAPVSVRVQVPEPQ